MLGEGRAKQIQNQIMALNETVAQYNSIKRCRLKANVS